MRTRLRVSYNGNTTGFQPVARGPIPLTRSKRLCYTAHMEKCVFCEFTDAAVVVHEDDLCYAVISAKPINRYHVLVIPRAHYENFTDLPDELAAHIFLTAKKLSLAVRKTCNPSAIHHLSDDDIQKKGYNLVPHYKFHIIPRFPGDKIIMEWYTENLDFETRTRLAEEIKQQFVLQPIWTKQKTFPVKI